MESGVSIRSLNNTYCQQVIDLILPIQQKEFNVPLTVEAQPDLLDIEASYIRPGGGFWGAIAGEAVVGSIALMNVGHGAGVIRKMFVRKEFRGKELSIAQRLLDTLAGHCGQRGISDLYLGTIDRMKAAHRFYERNGFRPIEMGDLPSYFPRMPTDNLFYHLHL